MRRFIGLFIIVGIILCIILVPRLIDWTKGINDYVHITAVNYDATIIDEASADIPLPNIPYYQNNQTGGRIRVKEQVTFDIHAASQSNPMRELWRELPEDNVDGAKVRYKVIGVKQISVDGQPSEMVLPNSGRLYWDSDFYSSDYSSSLANKWFHSPGPYNEWDLWECVLIYVDVYRSTIVYEIEYEMYNASLRYGDCSEYYVSMYSGDSIKHLNSFKGQIHFPNDKMPKGGCYNAYTYGTNAHAFPFEKSTTKKAGHTTFHFELNKSKLKFKPYNRYIEFALISHGEDKHIFTQYASQNDYYYEPMLAKINKAQADYEALPVKYRNIKLIVLTVLVAITALVLFIIIRKDKKLREKHKFFSPTMQTDLYREIPSGLDTNFAGALVFSKHKMSDDVKGGYAAAMLSLVRKSYIDVDRINGTKDWQPANIKIIIKHDVPDYNKKKLTQTEEQYYHLILRHAKGSSKDEISLASFQQKVSEDYDNTYSFVRKTKGAVRSMGVQQGYFQKADYKGLKKIALGWTIALMIIGVIIMIAGNLISYQTRLDLAFGGFFIFGAAFIVGAILLKIFSKRYVFLTQFGEDEYVKWRGLYNFLNSETLLKEKTVLDVSIWEDYLIYATAFGISEKVIKALNVRFPNANISPVLRNPYFRTRVFYFHSTRSFRSATRTASWGSRSGGWGGYGGGGRGGGGGGGGH